MNSVPLTNLFTIFSGAGNALREATANSWPDIEGIPPLVDAFQSTTCETIHTVEKGEEEIYCYARGVTSAGDMVVLSFYKSGDMFVKRVHPSFLGDLSDYPVKELSEAVADEFRSLVIESPIKISNHPFHYLETTQTRFTRGVRKCLCRPDLSYEEIKYLQRAGDRA